MCTLACLQLLASYCLPLISRVQASGLDLVIICFQNVSNWWINFVFSVLFFLRYTWFGASIFVVSFSRIMLLTKIIRLSSSSVPFEFVFSIRCTPGLVPLCLAIFHLWSHWWNSSVVCFVVDPTFSFFHHTSDVWSSGCGMFEFSPADCESVELT